MLTMSLHAQEMGFPDVNSPWAGRGSELSPTPPGPVARVMTSQPLLPVVLCPFYHFKAVRWEEEGLLGVGGPCFFQDPPPLSPLPWPQW